MLRKDFRPCGAVFLLETVEGIGERFSALSEGGVDEVAETFFVVEGEWKWARNKAQNGAGDFGGRFEAGRGNVHDRFDVVVVLSDDGENAVGGRARLREETQGDFALKHEHHAAEGDVGVDEAEVDLGSDVVGEV